MKNTKSKKSTEEQTPKRLDPDVAKARKAMASINASEQNLKKVDAILSYEGTRDRCGLVDFGIGYRKGTNKLVEFNIPKREVLPTASGPFKINAITLIDSLEWVETMLRVDERLDLCIQTGPALANWLGELRGALEEHSGVGDSA